MSKKPTFSSVAGMESAIFAQDWSQITTLNDLVEDDKLRDSRSNGPVFY